MSGSAIAGTGSTSVYNALVPPEGPKTVLQSLAFDGSTTSYTIDFSLAFMQGKLSAVQTLWFDASLNPAATSVLILNSGQTLTLPARAIGSLPIIAPARPKIMFSNATAGLVQVQFLNVPLPALVYQADGSDSPAPAAMVSPAAHAVATGGTAVVAFAAGSINGGFVTNPNSATESLFVDLINTAGTSSPGANGTTIELTAGASLPIPAGFAGAVSVNAATNGHTFLAVGYLS